MQVDANVPAGPAEPFTSGADLLRWMGEQIARFGDIFKASVYGSSVYVLNRPEYFEHVLLRNWRNYPKGRAIKRIGLLLGNGLMVSSGDLWARQRRMIQPAFNRSALGWLIELIVEENRALLERWESAATRGEAVNATKDIRLTILNIVLKSIFGADFAEVAPKFSLVAEEAARDLEFAATFSSLSKCVAELVASRRARSESSGADLLDMLMHARDRESGRAMSDAQLIKETMTLIVAGHETTASTLNWTWYLLSQSPRVDAKLASELETSRAADIVGLDSLKSFGHACNVIEEAMRLYPPGWLLTRRALRADRIGGYDVAPGTEIYLAPYFLHRHPEFWPEPDRFDPDRFSAERSAERPSLAYLPFSVGPRNCIGEHLARLEMQIHLVLLARRLKLNYAARAAPEMAAGINLLTKHDLVMQPQLRSCATTAA